MEKGRLQTPEKGDCKHRKGETADKGECKQKKEGTGKERQPKLFKAVAPSTRNLLSKHGHGA